jgi:hypothetical protein
MQKYYRVVAKLHKLSKLNAGNDAKLAHIEHIRSTIARKRQYLAELPGKQDVDLKEFDEWLEGAKETLQNF